MSVFDKKQKRKKRLIKKRVNQQRAKKQELDAQLELQRNILATLIIKNELTFSPERYFDLMQELAGEESTPIEYDSTEYWIIVSQLRKLESWIRNMDSKGRQWQFNPDYVDRVCRQLANGELPAVTLWADAQEAAGPVVTETGKVLGDADHDIRGDSDPAAEGGTLHGDEP
jgi:hypothetical protein